MKYLICLLSVLVFSSNSQASEMVGAVSAGMGGTGRTAVEPTESVFLNPASLALADGFHTAGTYQTGFLSKDISRNTFGVTMTDATDGIFLPGSFAYRRHHINDRGSRISENEYRVGLGYRVNPRLSLGMGASHLRSVDAIGQEFNQTNLNLGVLVGLTPNWGLSMNGENIIEAAEDTPEALLRPSRASIGTQYVFDRRVTFRYEALMPLYSEKSLLFGHRAGMGIDMKGRFQLNAGYSVDDNLAQNWTSVGLAWRGPRLKVAYSYQTEGRSELGVRHLVDLWLDI